MFALSANMRQVKLDRFTDFAFGLFWSCPSGDASGKVGHMGGVVALGSLDNDRVFFHDACTLLSQKPTPPAVVISPHASFHM